MGPKNRQPSHLLQGTQLRWLRDHSSGTTSTTAVLMSADGGRIPAEPETSARLPHCAPSPYRRFRGPNGFSHSWTLWGPLFLPLKTSPFGFQYSHVFFVVVVVNLKMPVSLTSFCLKQPALPLNLGCLAPPGAVSFFRLCLDPIGKIAPFSWFP